MHKIILENIGKRYNREWIFRDVNFEFLENNAYVILGSNGSGKSTFLQVLAGNLIPSSGQINFSNSSPIAEENIYKHVSIATPYLELIEEFTLTEQIDFHAKFKNLIISKEEIIEFSGLGLSKSKQVNYFSSGMKQRLRLLLAILSDTKLLLLDEPISNLDKQGVLWYKDLIEKYTKNRITIVCSNQQQDEHFFCEHKINIENYK